MAPNQKFWASATLEPKRAHRWLLSLGPSALPDYICKRVDKPSFSVGQSEHMFFGHSFYYPGTVKWQPITVTVVDPIQPDVATGLYQILKNMGYDTPDNREAIANEQNSLGTVSKARATEVFGDTIYLKQFSPINGVDELVEEWSIHNPWIKDVKFGGLDYGSEAIVDITLTIVYDFAKVDRGPGAKFF